MKRNILTFLLSLVVALGLWLYVVTVVSPDSENTYYNVPVGLQNESVLEERGLMVTTTDVPTVNLRLAGNRTDLDKLTSANITVAVDVSKIYEPGEHKLPYTISFPGDIPNNAVTTQKRTPDTVTLTVEERTTETVDVVVEYTGTQAEGYNVDKENIELSHTQINITGPKRIVSQVVAARITINLNDQEETMANVKVPYTLVDKGGKAVVSTLIEDGLETPGIITVEKLRIMQVKTVKLTAKVVAGGGATAETSEITFSPETITVSGSDQLLKELGDVWELGTIQLGELVTDERLTFEIKLPEGITCESGETEVAVDVRFPNLRTKTFSITDIKAINVPKDMNYQIITKVLEIRFRGPKALIDEMDSGDVTVAVDFSDGKAGTQTRQVTITMNSDYGEVGAVGTYTVSTTLKEK